jgi:hypothetical protein
MSGTFCAFVIRPIAFRLTPDARANPASLYLRRPISARRISATATVSAPGGVFGPFGMAPLYILKNQFVRVSCICALHGAY